MKKPYVVSAAALLLTSVAFSAQALTTSVTSGSVSGQAGASTVDFGNSALNNYAPVSGSLPSGTLGGVQYSYTGGALFNFDSSSNLPNGISARPVGSTENFWSIGNNPVAQSGPGVVSFASGVSYFGFLWGSPDAYNHVSFYDEERQLATFDGSAILVPPTGDQTYARYFNAFAGQGELITRVTFTSLTNAFETDNHAFLAPGPAVAAIPEPETYAMLLAGLGLMGLVARRRRQAALA